MRGLTKNISLFCNEKFIWIKGGITCTMLGDPIDSAQKKLPHPFDNLTLGLAVKTCLENSKELTVAEWDEKYGTDDKAFYESMAKKIDEMINEMIYKYGFKDENAFNKNMMSSGILVYDDLEIVVDNSIHDKLESWDFGDFKVKIRYDSPDEILGATVRYALAKCRGKGSYAKGAEMVSKILFPEGVPDSVKEYLASIDPDYEKWLIK